MVNRSLECCGTVVTVTVTTPERSIGGQARAFAFAARSFCCLQGSLPPLCIGTMSQWFPFQCVGSTMDLDCVYDCMMAALGLVTLLACLALVWSYCRLQPSRWQQMVMALAVCGTL